MQVVSKICERFGSLHSPPGQDEILGLAIETLGQFPINGLRHEREGRTCGWYIWCGEEMSDDPEFFKPLHVRHIKDYLPEIDEYLALESGFRFLVHGDYEDVWRDSSLLGV